MHKVTARLDDDLFARLQLAAVAKGTSRAQIIREALCGYLERHHRKSKSVGPGRSGNPDMSVRAEDYLAGMGVRR